LGVFLSIDFNDLNASNKISISKQTKKTGKLVERGIYQPPTKITALSIFYTIQLVFQVFLSSTQSP